VIITWRCEDSKDRAWSRVYFPFVCIWELVSCHTMSQQMSQHKFCTCWITCWWSHVIMAATDDDSPIISLSNLNQQLSTALNHHHTLTLNECLVQKRPHDLHSWWCYTVVSMSGSQTKPVPLYQSCFKII